MIEILLSKDFILLSSFFILGMTFSFMGLLGAITRHLLMFKGYSLGFREYKDRAAMFWGLIFFLGFAIFPLLLFLGLTRDKLNTSQSLIYFTLLLVISLVIAVLARRWAYISHQTNFSGEGIKWGYKVIILLLITLPFMAVSAYSPSYLSISLTLLLFILGLVLPYVSTYATWWIFTVGGRLPLPQQHAWIAPNKKASQKEYIKTLSTIFPFLIVLILLVLNLSLNITFIFLKALAWFIIFHLGMTISVIIKGRNFVNSKY